MRVMEVVVMVGAIESVYGVLLVLVVRVVGYLEVPCRVLLWSGGS